MKEISELKKRIKIARGDMPADLVIKGGKVVDIFNGRVLEADVAISGDKIAGIGEYRGKKEFDCHGGFIVPGFIDSHIHLESTMLSPSEFVRVVLLHGTTTVIIDPHEIANVSGMAGIRYVLKASKGPPLSIYVMAPSCVPASELETYGHRITDRDIERLLREDRVLGLAEVMAYAGVVEGREGILRKIAKVRGKVIDGHSPLLSGKTLCAYLTAGISTDHEATNYSEGLEKLSLGMFLMIREGTVARNLKELLSLVGPYSVDRIFFASDDILPIELMEEGHINRIMRRAVSLGLDPVYAVRMATINPARHYGFRDLGAIAPGYRADISIVEDLRDFKVKYVFKHGRLVIDSTGFKGRIKRASVSSQIYNSIKARPVNVGELTYKAKGVLIDVIEIIPGEVINRRLRLKPKVIDKFVVSDTERDILKVAVVDRHRYSGNIGIGFVKGMGLKDGAMASSVAHDAHNIVCVGTNDNDMAVAINHLREIKGGLVIAKGGRVIDSLPLPIAGLMSDRPANEVYNRLLGLYKSARELGVQVEHPFITLSFLSLPVIPEIRVTDKGIIDVIKGKIISVR